MQSIQTHTLLIAFLCTTLNGKRLDDGYYDISTYTNCNGLDDDYYDIEVTPNHSINLYCSHEYMIIDISHDSKWTQLLSSVQQYHEHIIGPATNDHVNWDSFMPGLEIEHYLVSPDCGQCDEKSYLNQGLYADHSAYYMNQIASGCFHKNRGLPACDMDPLTYVCKICEWTEGTVLSRPYSTASDYANDDNTGICAFSIKPSNFIVATDFSQCLNYETSAYKPSLGTHGQYCQCIKTDASNGYRIRKKKLSKNIAVETYQKQSDNNEVTYLYQSDFEHGTYRIQNGGTYVVMEDIAFDFNANSDAPNAEGSYMPQCDQSDAYPGACSQFGPYFLGFFSGITVETHDGVILDLNEHTIGMSKSFFYQQGFFSIIELGSQPFVPMHGPGNFGVNPKWAQNVVIKNGILSRSSHHGIHGNNNKNIEIRNIAVKHFVTHGIQLNGFTDITLTEIDIGPSNSEVRLNGNYVQMRALLNNMRTLSRKTEVQNTKFSFVGRKHDTLTLDELVEERLVPLMNEAFEYALGNEANIANGNSNPFIFDGNIPYGAVVYGLFLNYPSSGIFGWHVSQDQSNGARLENIRVHDLSHSSEEMIGLTTNKHGISNVLNGPLSAEALVGSEMMTQITNVISSKSGEFHASYIGDIVTDIHLAYYKMAYEFAHDWDLFPGTPYYGDNSELVYWAFGDDPYYENVISSDRITTQQELDELVTCNGDRMQHPLKGIVGIKISGVSNVQFGGSIEIQNLKDSSPLGSTLCGAYDKANFGQQLPYSLGYSGNMIHGMDVSFSDIRLDLEQFSIHTLISDTGLAYALSLWYGTQVEFSNHEIEYTIMNVKAGNKYLDDIPSDNDARYTAPNHKPQACAIRIHENTIYPTTLSFGSDDSIFKQQCVIGLIGCEQNTQKNAQKVIFTHVGTVNNAECQDIRNNDNMYVHKQEMIQNVHYFGNVFMMSVLFAIVISAFAVYYWFCFVDREHLLRKKARNSAYGSF